MMQRGQRDQVGLAPPIEVLTVLDVQHRREIAKPIEEPLECSRRGIVVYDDTGPDLERFLDFLLSKTSLTLEKGDTTALG